MSKEIQKAKGRTIPFYERFKALYSVGYPLGTIAPILQKEFDHIEVANITEREIQGIYLSNKEEFDAARAKFAMNVQAQTMKSLLTNFVKGRDVETRMLDVYSEKLEDLLEKLPDTDPLDPDGRFFKITGAIETIHKGIRMIAGTAAVREFELFKQKEEVKARHAVMIERAKADKLGNGGFMDSAAGGSSDAPKIEGDTPEWG